MKTKHTLLNFITEVVPLVLIMFIGLYKSKYLILNLSENYVGLYQLYFQLLGYITIFESGVTGALLYKFFKPVSKKNQEKINILYSTGKKIYSIIAIIMFFVGFIFSLFIPLIIKDNPFQTWYITITFLIYISSTIIYYLVATEKVLLEANQKKHITNIIISSADILKSVLELLIIIIFKNLILLLLAGTLTSTISAIVIVSYCKKSNKSLNKTKEKDYSILKDVKSLFVHKIAYLANNNVDLILVTRFLGLSSVVIYSTYNYITNSLKKVTSRIYVSIIPSLGNLIVENKEQSKKIFYEINDFIFFIAILIFGSLVVVINPFIDIWYVGKIETTRMLSIGFPLVLYSTIAIQPLQAFTEAGGCFKETKKCAITEVIINLVLSLLLLNKIGIFGILIATFLAYTIADNILRAKIICKNVLNISPKKYYIDLITFYVITFLITTLNIYYIKLFIIKSIIKWLLISISVFIIDAIILLFLFKILNKLEVANRIKKIIVRKA